MRTRAVAMLCVLSTGLWGACSSDDQPNQVSGSGGSTGAGGHAGSGGGAGTGVHDPSKNCVKPGTTGNEKGIGRYCTSSGECVSPTGGFLVCSGDVPGTPLDAWFCTTI